MNVVWAFYLSNGSIERRTCDAVNASGANLKFPFKKWYRGKIRALKTVLAQKEDKTEICPNNSHAHHLSPSGKLSRLCRWCSQ